MTLDEINVAMVKYRAKRVGHFAAALARDGLMRKLRTVAGERVFALIGPSGVGKSTVLAKVVQLLLEVYKDEMARDPGFIPFVVVKAVTRLDAKYNWRDGFARLLLAGNEPLVGKKMAYLSLQLDGVDIAGPRGLVRDELRRAFESMVKNRGMRHVLVDEGSAVLDTAVNADPIREFNILKSLSVNLGVSLGLVGGYDLAKIRDGPGQLLRRSELIHMRRYQLGAFADVGIAAESKTTTGLEHFTNARDALNAAVPVTCEAGTFDDAPWFLIKSVGCVGIYRDWLDAACVEAYLVNDGVLTFEIMERTAPLNDTVIKLTKEAQLGEQQLEDSPDSELAALYGLKSLKGIQAQEAAAPSVQPRAKRRVGQRNPSRDPVGGLYD